MFLWPVSQNLNLNLGSQELSLISLGFLFGEAVLLLVLETIKF